jgi:hypothetical protein
VGLFLLPIAAIRYRIKLNVIFLARRGLGLELQIQIAQLRIGKPEVPTGLFPGFNTSGPALFPVYSFLFRF